MRRTEEAAIVAALTSWVPVATFRLRYDDEAKSKDERYAVALFIRDSTRRTPDISFGACMDMDLLRRCLDGFGRELKGAMTIFDYNRWREGNEIKQFLHPIEAFRTTESMVPPRFNPFCATVRKLVHQATIQRVLKCLQSGRCSFITDQEIDPATIPRHKPTCEECVIAPFLDSTGDPSTHNIPWYKCQRYVEVSHEVSPCYKSDSSHFESLIADIAHEGLEATVSNWAEKPEKYVSRCWAGFLEMGMPLLMHNHLVAFAMGGQALLVADSATEDSRRKALSSLATRAIEAARHVPCLQEDSTLKALRQCLGYHQWRRAEAEHDCTWLITEQELAKKAARMKKNAMLIQTDASERHASQRRIQEDCFHDELCARLEESIAIGESTILHAIPCIIQRMRAFWAFKDVVFLAQAGESANRFTLLADSERVSPLKENPTVIPTLEFSSGRVPPLGILISTVGEPNESQRPGCKWIPTVQALERLRGWEARRDMLLYVTPTLSGQVVYVFYYRDVENVSLKPREIEPSRQCTESIRRVCSSLSKRLSVAAERQHLTEHLKDAQAKLEELAGDILASARDMASGGMVRMLNHDIRSALSDLGVVLEGLELRPSVHSDHKVRSDILKLRHDTLDITERLEELLRHFRTAGAEQPVEMHEIPPLVNRAISLCSGRCRREGITLTRQFAESLPGIQCYDVELVEVVYNLLTNAIKALRASTNKEIAVSLQLIEGTKVQIEICDTGCGITPSDKQHLFQPFFSRTGSSGMGLFSCKEVVSKLRGHIGCKQTTVGRGSTFFITLDGVWKRQR